MKFKILILDTDVLISIFSISFLVFSNLDFPSLKDLARLL
jgi:hypothetical protein